MMWLYIALGGALGAMARYALGHKISELLGATFPYGTLSINLLGSFFIGVLWVWFAQPSWGNPAYKHVLIIGFLGAFTTFSSFSLESLLLLQQDRFLAFFLYVGTSVVACLSATGLGFWVTKHWV